MNDKAKFLYGIIDATIECCSMEIDDEGTMSLTIDDVLGSSRRENVTMTRCICVMILATSGYSITTISKLFGRTPHSIRHILAKSKDYYETSRAFRIAHAEAVLKCRDLEGDV